ncbi:putative superfamily II helicase [Cafeteria roenbergensis virus]|uniref:Putative superfamily II helicase n=1 Tax=Cafeteria roenbergensis virus (strain BV-PW1) TaxID=693272 RepID=E3T5H3_CROVB|nr:putative superfamily II helicase [Cafeteria roenbergensis virus BV-PW1]ADO67436.1 putative superfamily II helicase [Cafeteria roenbergensis virus BV-PW1]
MNELVIERIEPIICYPHDIRNITPNIWINTIISNGKIQFVDTLVGNIDNNQLIEVKIKSPYLDFISNPVPYLDTKLELLNYNGQQSKIRITIKIKNINKVIDYLNHDYILKNFILSDYIGDANKILFTKYNLLQTSIYKNKIKINPSNKITLFDYQLNNIDKMTKIINNPIKVSSNIIINMYPCDENELEYTDKNVYYNRFDKQFKLREDFVEFKTNGVILADEMGLGKTITMIAYLKSLKSIISDPKLLKAKGHLIVVPSHLATQWVGEINKIWENAKIKLILTKRDHVNITTEEILDYDFVIITQQFLINKNHYLQYPGINCTPSTFNIETRLNKFKNNQGAIKIKDVINIPPIFELITWNNLILDEAHEIMGNTFGNSYSISNGLNNVICNLKGINKWYVSGTPYDNQQALHNIFNYLEVTIKEQDKYIKWNLSKFKNIIYSYNFLSKIVLRHSKKQVEEQLNLKGVEEKIYWLTQTDTEKQIYEGSKFKGRSYLLKLCCHLMVADYNSDLSVQTVDIEDVKHNIQERSTSQIKKYTDLLEKLQPTNQAYHMIKAKYIQIISQSKFMLESIKHLTHNNDDNNDDNDDNDNNDDDDNECPICLDKIIQSTILPCGHIFCYECIQAITKVKKVCPLCKQEINNKLICIADKNSKSSNIKSDSLITKYGVKTGTLIKLVRKITSNPENNIIIFSQYDFMLKLISVSLSQNGVSNSFVKGNVFQRNKAIETFRGLRMNQSSKVIMLSLKNAASGTHLVEANHIIFVDPVDSTKDSVIDIENQAIARAFRIGQKKKVYIHRLLIKDTIEENIYNTVYL